MANFYWGSTTGGQPAGQGTGNFEDAANWWMDPALTVQATSYPKVGDTANTLPGFYPTLTTALTQINANIVMPDDAGMGLHLSSGTAIYLTGSVTFGVGSELYSDNARMILVPAQQRPRGIGSDGLYYPT